MKIEDINEKVLGVNLKFSVDFSPEKLGKKRVFTAKILPAEKLFFFTNLFLRILVS